LGLIQICSIHGYCPCEGHQSQNSDYRKHGFLLSVTVPDYKLTAQDKAAIKGSLGFSNFRNPAPSPNTLVLTSRWLIDKNEIQIQY
jgi:hypothetical protein